MVDMRNNRTMASSTLQSEVKKQKPFDSLEQEVYLNLVRSASVLSGPFCAMFKQHELSQATYNVLRILRGVEQAGEDEGLPCLEISSRLVTRVPDITRLVDRLVTAGLVKRKRADDDRRVVNVGITAKGKRTLEKLDDAVNALHVEQLQHLSKAELRKLNALLEKMRQSPSE